ncbi:hypothetical protein [Ewingella americana]|uniref:hypothetical protein n=1 Tax=Ewingella americana TaxID=41202 RepID=UPI001F4FEECE|nr:hypothetical protein [Ewingella americana]
MTAQILTKEQLDVDLRYYVENKDSIAVIVYAITKGNPTPLRMDIEAPAQSGLKSLFLDVIQKDVIDNEELTLLPLSSADERGNSALSL